MQKHTITPRRTTAARRRCSQLHPGRVGLADLFIPGLRVAWHAFWRDVEHPCLVRGVVLLFPLLALLVLLAHLALPSLAGAAQEPGQWRPSPTPPVRAIAAKVQAFYQGDPNVGWDSRAQYDTWWPSACSPAALTMVFRAWGAPVHIGQVLDRLIAQQAITPQHGLLHADALATVAQGFGFQATTFWHWTLDNVAQVTSQGVPVLVDVVDAKRQTPYPGFSVGHWLVVVGVSANQVDVRDSSGYHLPSLSPALFHILATGIGVVLWQGTLDLPKEA